MQDCGCGAELDSIAQFIAKIKTVMVYNFYVRNTDLNIFKNTEKLKISDFGTIRVGLFLGPADPSEAPAH